MEGLSICDPRDECDLGEQLIQNVKLLLETIRSGPLGTLDIAYRPALQRASIFDSPVSPQITNAILDKSTDAVSSGHILLARAIGCLVGMAVADGIGHFFEFLPVQDKPSVNGPYFEFPCISSPDGSGSERGHFHGALNRFRIRRGQWTDDTSMGMCLADSILVCGCYDGTSARAWYWNWWNNGLNNAFRLDFDRENVESIGLGSNIARQWPSHSFQPSYDQYSETRP